MRLKNKKLLFFALFLTLVFAIYYSFSQIKIIKINVGQKEIIEGYLGITLNSINTEDKSVIITQTPCEEGCSNWPFLTHEFPLTLHSYQSTKGWQHAFTVLWISSSSSIIAVRKSFQKSPYFNNN